MFRPHVQPFRSVHTEFVRKTMQWFDRNNDYQLSGREARFGARVFDFYSQFVPEFKSLSEIYTNVANGIYQQNPSIDTNQDGFFTYDRDPDIRFIRDPGPTELGLLARRDGNANDVSYYDLKPRRIPRWWREMPIQPPTQ